MLKQIEILCIEMLKQIEIRCIEMLKQIEIRCLRCRKLRTFPGKFLYSQKSAGVKD